MNKQPTPRHKWITLREEGMYTYQQCLKCGAQSEILTRFLKDTNSSNKRTYSRGERICPKFGQTVQQRTTPIAIMDHRPGVEDMVLPTPKPAVDPLDLINKRPAREGEFLPPPKPFEELVKGAERLENTWKAIKKESPLTNHQQLTDVEARLKECMVMLNLAFEDLVSHNIRSHSRRVIGRFLYSAGYEEIVKKLDNE